MKRTSPIFEFIIIMVSWDNPTIILRVPSKAIRFGIWICYLPIKDRTIVPYI